MANKIVVINAGHKLMPQQIDLLGGEGEFERCELPESGATLSQAQEIHLSLHAAYVRGALIVIASPFAALMAMLARQEVFFYVFHNDRREAREVPDGKGGVRVVHTVAAEGWVIY